MELIAKADYDRAEPLVRRALAISEKALGPEHPQTAAALANLGHLLRKKGDYAGAEPLYRRALAIIQKVYGENDPRTQAIRSALVEDRLHLRQRP